MPFPVRSPASHRPQPRSFARIPAGGSGRATALGFPQTEVTLFSSGFERTPYQKRKWVFPRLRCVSLYSLAFTGLCLCKHPGGFRTGRSLEEPIVGQEGIAASPPGHLSGALNRWCLGSSWYGGCPCVCCAHCLGPSSGSSCARGAFRIFLRGT